jgi:hypothetical protein
VPSRLPQLFGLEVMAIMPDLLYCDQPPPTCHLLSVTSALAPRPNFRIGCHFTN